MNTTVSELFLAYLEATAQKDRAFANLAFKALGSKTEEPKESLDGIPAIPFLEAVLTSCHAEVELSPDVEKFVAPFLEKTRT